MVTKNLKKQFYKERYLIEVKVNYRSNLKTNFHDSFSLTLVLI